MMSLVLVAALLLQDPRGPVPEGAALRETEKLVRDVFKDDYAKRAPADRQALARKLLQQAAETRDNPNARYVLLKEARALATDAGDAETALQAVDESAKHYRIDGLALKQSTLATLLLAAKTPVELKTFAFALLQLASEALVQNNFDAAEKAAAAAVPAAQRAKDVALLAKAQAKSKEIADLKAKFEQVRKALDTLIAQPDDPAANLLVGIDLCLSKGKWDEGLPKLVKGSDPALRALAARDLAAPKDATEQSAVGDGWWTVSERESGPARARARQRSAFWYQTAIAGATGLSRIRLEKRILEVKSESSVDLLRMIDPALDGILGPWVLDGQGLQVKAGGGIRPQLVVPYTPPEEYDLTMVVERKGGAHYFILGMMSGAARFSLVLDSWPDKGYIYGFQFVDGKFVIDNESARKGQQFLRPNKAATVTCSVRRTGVAVTVDGNQILNWTAGYDRLSAFSGAPSTGIFFEIFESSYLISQLSLIPLSGEGTRTR